MADTCLVIKIPTEIYEASQILDVKHDDVIQIPLEVIKNGKPLPKGYGDLIDRNELLTKSYYIDDWLDNELNVVDVKTIEMTDVIIKADKE